MKTIYKIPEIEVIEPVSKWTIMEKSGDGVLPPGPGGAMTNQNISFDEDESNESANSGLWDD